MKNISYIIILLFISSVTFSQEANGLFYKASKDNQQIYLFGTIAGKMDKKISLKKEISATYERINNLVIDIDVSKDSSFNNEIKTKIESGDLSLLAEHLGKTFYTDGDSLKNHLSEKSMHIVSEKYKNILSENELNFVKPWFALILLILSEYDVDDVSESPIKCLIDGRVNKDITYLTDIKDQFNLFITLSDEEVNYIIETFEDNYSDENTSNKVNAWIKGDKKKLKKFYEPKSKIELQLEKKFVINQNYKYLDKLTKIAKEKKEIFVIMNYENLICEESVLDLLKKEGYKIEKID